MLSLVVDGRQNQESSGDSLLGHSQRLCAHIWRQDVPILPVAFAFPPKRTYQSYLQFITIWGTLSAPPMSTSHKDPRTRINTLQIAVANRMRGTRGAMVTTMVSVLNVVGSEGNGGEGDDEGRRDGRTGSEPRGTFFAGKRSGDRDALGRLSPRVAPLRPRAVAVSKQWG